VAVAKDRQQIHIVGFTAQQAALRPAGSGQSCGHRR
jgi:hypothetical protein